MSVTLRRAEAADAESIHALIVELAVFEREPDAVLNTPENLREQLSQASPPFECVVAESAGEVVAFALYFFTYSTWEGRQSLYLEDLYVRQSVRRRGVASALMGQLAAIALERGCRRFDWSVLRWNAGAIALYDDLQAAPQTEWLNYRLSGDALRTLAKGRP